MFSDLLADFSTRCYGESKVGLGKFVKSSYIPICLGLSGQIGALEIDCTRQPDKSNIPIDCLVVGLTKDLKLDEE